MAMGRRRKGSGVTDFLSNIVDDVKDFVDDEIIDRGRSTERDVRRTAGDLTDERNGSRLEEIGQLRNAIRSLAGKVEAVAASRAATDKADADKAAAEKAAADKAAADRAAAVRAAKPAAAKPAAAAVNGAKVPWPHYDEQTVVEIREALTKADAATLSAVKAYEAGHKKRQGVLKAASAS